MAASSVGKLDAICARLKSSQQTSQPAAGSTDETAGAQNAVEEVRAAAAAHDPVRSKKSLVNKSQENVGFKLDKFSADKLPHEASENGQRVTDISEKVQIQSKDVDAAFEPSIKDGIITKHNNNNVAEATDYNNEIDSSTESTTFHTADSTSANADSVVSSTTAEPVLCNEDIPASQASYIPVRSSVVQSYTSPESTVKYEANSLLMVCPQSSSSSSSTAALLSTPDFLSSQCSISPQYMKSSNEQRDDVPDVNQSNINCGNGRAFAVDYPANSSVTSTQGISLGEDIAVHKIHEGTLSNGIVPSSSVPRPSSFLPSVSSAQASVNAEDGSKSRLSLTPGGIDFARSLIRGDSLLSNERNKPVRKGYIFDNSEPEISTENAGSSQYLESDLFPDSYKHPDISNITSSNQDGGSAVPEVNASELAADVEQHHNENTATPASQKLSGRRKSRKSAKPQKQISGRLYTDHNTEQELQFGNPDCVNPEERNGDFISNPDSLERPLELVKSPKSNESTVSNNFMSSPSNPSLPLDLSLGNSNNHSTLANEASRNKLSVHESCVNSVNSEISRSVIKPVATNSIISEKIDDEVAKKPYNDSKVPTSRSPALETADSKVLVDFANNTMKELLEIYGFEGQDTKSVILNNLQPEKLNEFPNVDDRSYIMPLVKEEDAESQTAKSSKSRSIKGGAFRRNVSADSTEHVSRTSEFFFP